ncbi:MAG: Ig-like domain-containing protein [Myxococcota bacterium]
MNDPPYAGPDGATTPAATAIDVPVLDNDGDIDSPDITISRSPRRRAGGMATINPDGTDEHEPDAGFSGDDHFGYEVCDDEGACATAQVTIGVGLSNAPPVVEDDDIATLEGTPVRVPVLDNDSDPEGDDLVISFVGTPGHGTTVVTDLGDIIYTPAKDFVGDDSTSRTPPATATAPAPARSSR